MSFDPVSQSEILSWHHRNGGSGARPAGHALRLLRECVELCVASGASEAEIKMAVRRECDKASDRADFQRLRGTPAPLGMLEEFIDVYILFSIFRQYFLSLESVENELRRKLDICNEREWAADADGVLWRPGYCIVG